MFNQGNCLGGFGEMGNHMMGGSGIMFIGLILVVGIMFYLFSKSGNNNQILQSDGALDVLKKRFANSEISEEEYLAKKTALSN